MEIKSEMERKGEEEEKETARAKTKREEESKKKRKNEAVDPVSGGCRRVRMDQPRDLWDSTV